MIAVSMNSVKKVLDSCKKKNKAVERAIMRATFKGAVLVQKRARSRIMKGPKSGRKYRRGKTVVHQASAPGQPPANDTGNLQKSILVVQGEFSQGVAHASIEVHAKYAADLELGTRFMEARPYLAPSLKESIKEINVMLKDEVKKALKS